MRQYSWRKAVSIFLVCALVFTCNSATAQPLLALANDDEMVVQKIGVSSAEEARTAASGDDSGNGAEAFDTAEDKGGSEAGGATENNSSIEDKNAEKNEDAGEAVNDGEVNGSSEDVDPAAETKNPEKENETPSRDARDVTSEESMLTIALKAVAYDGAEGVPEVVEAVDGFVDVSACDPHSVSKFELRYEIVAQPGALVAGDTFKIEVSQEFFAIDAVALNKANLEEPTWGILSLENNAVTAAISETAVAAEGPVTAALHIPVSLIEESLCDQPTEVVLPLQGNARATVLLPALPVEEADGAMSAEDIIAETSARIYAVVGDALEEGETEAVLEKEWRDNNYGERPVEALKGILTVSFSLDGGRTFQVLDDTTKGLIDLEDIPAIVCNSKGSHTTYSCSPLPATVGGGDDDPPIAISYIIEEDPIEVLKLGYMQSPDESKGADDKTVYNVKTVDFKTTVIMRDGGKDSNGTSRIKYICWKDSKSEVHRILVNGGNSTSAKACDKDGNPKEGYTLTVPNLPMYDLDDNFIDYYVELGDVVTDPLDSDSNDLECEFNNTDSPNHGPDVAQGWNGGSITLTQNGETSYSATKIWLDELTTEDDRDKNRPAGTLYLWRYTDKGGGDYMQAAQVRDGSGTLITFALDKQNNTSIYTVKGVPADDGEGTEGDGTGADGVDGGTGIDGEGGHYTKNYALPKYDPEGYPYVYLLREALDGDGYKQIFGQVEDKDGTITVTDGSLPYDGKRKSSDQSVYNGGTLSNCRTATTVASQEKTWKASVYQNQISNVVVTLALWSKPANVENAEWKRTGDTDTLTGFRDETMTKAVEADVPLYDDLGRELEYEWREDALSQDGKPVDLVVKDGKTTFKLACNNGDATEYFTSAVEENPSKPGSDWVVNRVHGTTDYTVVKVWEGDVTPVPIEITLFQNGTAIGTYKMDGTEAPAWQLFVGDLPKYDDEGRLFTYVAEETGGQGDWHASYSFNAEERKTTITNSPGTGTHIRVEKEWLDDSDADHRYPATVRVYKKDTEMLGDKGAVVGDVVLNKGNNWWTWLSVDSGTASDYVAEELYLTNLGTQYFPILANGHTTVTTDHHAYEVTSGAKNVNGVDSLVVTNRRIGVVNLTATKTWVDQGADQVLRPEATLKLLCVEQENAVQEEAGKGSIHLYGCESQPILDNGSGPTGKQEQVSSQQTVGRTTDSGVSQDYYFFNLPKYDKDGRVVHYSIEEDAEGDSAYHVFVTQTEYKIGEYEDGEILPDAQKIAVDNKRSGTKNVQFHKSWKDAYSYERGKRPDIYLTLWRETTDSEGKTEYKPVGEGGFVDYRWVMNDDEGDSEYEWTAVFRNLDKFDGNGKEIVYYAQEVIKANASAFDYLRTFYPKDDIVVKTTDDKGEPIELLQEGGTFINAISSHVTISGTKIWKNLPAGFPSEELPRVTIVANQYLGNSQTAEAGFSARTTPKPTKTGTKGFSFELLVDDKGNEIPKYNEAGVLYRYELTEIVEGSPDGDVWANIYKLESNVFEVENTYNIAGKNSGSLQFTKEWPQHTAGQAYPSVKFELYSRFQHITAEGETEKWSDYTKAAAPRVLSATDSADNTTIVTFSNLPVYAPNGNKYEYQVRETSIDEVEKTYGYTVTVDDEHADATTPAATKPCKIQADAAEGSGSEGDEATGGEAGGGEAAGGEEAPTATNAGTFANAYNAGEIAIKGEKQWIDHSNAFGLRPENLAITLVRWADAQPKQNNAIGSESEPTPIELIENTGEVTNGNLTWEKSGNTWKYTITGLEQYAPNGMPWKYKIIETLSENSHYKGEPTSAKGSALDARVGSSEAGSIPILILGALKNELDTAASVEKLWAGDSGDSNNADPYQLRPEIKVQLQVSVDEAPFVPAKDVFESIMGTLYPGDGAFEKVLNNGNSWKGSFSTLPAGYYDTKSTSAAYKSFAYKVVEINLGDYPAYKLTSSETVGGKTTITNTMVDGGVSLTVKKSWDDSDNLYDTRPLSADGKKWVITVKLQRQFVDEDPKDENTWNDVCKTGTTSPVTETITDDRYSLEETSATFNNLPKFGMKASSEGQPAKETAYRYRAVETIPTGYSTPDYDYSFSPVGNIGSEYTNVTNIGNKLTTASVSGTKSWVGKETHPSKDVSLTLYRKVGSESPVKVTVPEEDFEWTTNSETGARTFTYSGLPAVDRTNRPYTYSVEEDPVPGGWLVSYPVSTDGSLLVTNTATTYSLQKKSAGQDAAVLPGSEFKIEGSFADGTDEKILKPGSATDKQPYTAELIAGNTYTITEMVPPKGYKTVDPFKIEMDSEGRLAFTDEYKDREGKDIDIAVYDSDNETIINAITVTDSKNDLTITKVDQFDRPVVGAELKLAPVAGSAFADATITEIEWTTAVDESTGDPISEPITGMLIADNVYELTESFTPERYMPPKTKTFLTMTADGELKWNSNKDADAEDWISVGEDKSNAFVFVNTMAFTHVKLVKVDENYEAFEGAMFSLYKKGLDDPIVERITPKIDGEGKASWTTEGLADEILNPDTGKMLKLGLANGEYYFKETATTDTYCLSKNEYSFKIGNDTDGTTVTVLVENVPNEVFFSKVDADSGALVEGAKFTLTGVFADSADGGEESKEWTSAKSAHAITGLLIAGNEYVLTETEPAPGYLNSPFDMSYSNIADESGATLTLKVDAAGQLYYKIAADADDDWVGEPIDRNMVQIRDVQNAASFLKVDSSDNAKVVSGTKFRLVENFGSKNVFATWTSEQDPTVVKGMLANEEYVLTETAAAPGYLVSPFTDSYKDACAADSLTVKVDGEGQLYYKTNDADADDSWVKLENPVNTVVVQDAKKPIEPKKPAKTGDVSLLALFGGTAAFGLLCLSSASLARRRRKE